METAADGVAMLSLEDKGPWEALKKQVRDHPIPKDTTPWFQKRLQDEKTACLLILDLLQAKGCAFLPKVFANQYEVYLQWGSLPRVIFLLYNESYRVDYQRREEGVYGGRFFPVSGGGEAVAKCILDYIVLCPITEE